MYTPQSNSSRRHLVVSWHNYLQQKCDQYWPGSGNAESYGPIEVSQLREDVLAHYTVRTFKIRHTKLKCGAAGKQLQGRHSERFVLQYHFTWWPESGCVPDDPMPLLNFVR